MQRDDVNKGSSSFSKTLSPFVYFKCVILDKERAIATKWNTSLSTDHEYFGTLKLVSYGNMDSHLAEDNQVGKVGLQEAKSNIRLSKINFKL